MCTFTWTVPVLQKMLRHVLYFQEELLIFLPLNPQWVPEFSQNVHLDTGSQFPMNQFELQFFDLSISPLAWY